MQESCSPIPGNPPLQTGPPLPEQLLFLMQQRNLVYNHEFLLWSNRKVTDQSTDPGVPDGWQYTNEGTNAQLANVNDRCRILVNKEGNEMTFCQALHEFPRWQKHLLGQRVAMRTVMSLTESCDVSIRMTDGVSSSVCHFIAPKMHDYVFELSLEVSAEATGLFVELASSTAQAVIQVKSIIANLGDVPLPGLPCMVEGVIGTVQQYIATGISPADELLLCNEPVELCEDQSRLDTVLNGRFGRGAKKRSLLPDIRGLFPRAWDNGAATDPEAADRVMLGDTSVKGDLPGTSQQESIKEHQHCLKLVSPGLSKPGGTAGFQKEGESETGKTGGKETRPVNFSLTYTIKYA